MSFVTDPRDKQFSEKDDSEATQQANSSISYFNIHAHAFTLVGTKVTPYIGITL